MICSDSQFLRWLHDRLVYVYNERPNTDFVLRLGTIADECKKLEDMIPELKQIHSEVKDIVKDLKDAKR